MKRTKTFAPGTELRRVCVQGAEFELEVDEHVFPPSANGSFYAESVRVNPGETVIDIGTGSGVLAIFAARSDASVYATDTAPHAVEVARRNAARNGVSVEFRRGGLFAGLEQKFDVILANLPNEIIHRSYLEQVGEEHIDFYLRLNEAGLIRIFVHDGAWHTNGYVFELSL